MSNLVRNPPFLFTYWNPFSKDSRVVGSWFDYVKDTSLAKYTAESMACYLEQTSDDQLKAIDQAGRTICGALHEGFSGLLDQFNQRMGLLLDEAMTSNLLQENIAELLRIPDSQKQRQYHIELGLKFLKNARQDEDLYQDALHELLEAEKLMPSDYFVLHRIGMIYLYVPALGNLEKALDYFSRAAKYAFVESHPDAVRLSNILNKSVRKQFADQAEPSPDDLGALAAESYYEAGNSLYSLGRFEEAAKMATKAVKCQPTAGRYHFFLAKYMTRLGNTDAAALSLQKAIELLPEMALATLGDFDLNRSQPLLGLLDAANTSVNAQVANGVERLDKWLTLNSHVEAPEILGIIGRGQERARSEYGALLPEPPDLRALIGSAQASLRGGAYSEKRFFLARLVSYDEVMLATLSAFTKIMASLNEVFIGQEQIKTDLALDLAMGIERRRGQPLDDLLLLGPAGMGKATLAHVLARCIGTQLRVHIKFLRPGGIKADGDLEKFLANLNPGDVLLIEDVDQLERFVVDILCAAMNAVFWNDPAISLNLPRFTVIGTAVSIGTLPDKLLPRFWLRNLEPYTKDERAALILHFARQRGIDSELAVKTLRDRDSATPQELYESLLP